MYTIIILFDRLFKKHRSMGQDSVIATHIGGNSVLSVYNVFAPALITGRPAALINKGG